jgi:hypothetical protein
MNADQQEFRVLTWRNVVYYTPTQPTKKYNKESGRPIPEAPKSFGPTRYRYDPYADLVSFHGHHKL